MTTLIGELTITVHSSGKLCKNEEKNLRIITEVLTRYRAETTTDADWNRETVVPLSSSIYSTLHSLVIDRAEAYQAKSYGFLGFLQRSQK